MCPLVVDAALPGIQPLFADSVTGTCCFAGAAFVTDRFLQFLIAFQRGICNDKAVSHERTVLFIHDFAAHSHFTDAAGFGSFAEINDDIRYRLSRFHGICMDQFIGIHYFRIGSFVPFDA